MANDSTDMDINDDNDILARYRRAEALDQERWCKSMVLNVHISPQWIGESDCFWYRRSLRKNPDSAKELATEYRLVNAKTATNTEAFDHTGLANALAEVTNQPVDLLSLPIDNLEFDQSHHSFAFDSFDQRWLFEDGAIKNVTKSPPPLPHQWVVSPDGTKAAFVKEHNLWVRNIDSGEERALTYDGKQYYAYAIMPEDRNLMGDDAPKQSVVHDTTEVLWSPDSSRLFTMQTDERQVRLIPSMTYAPQDGTVAPRMCERKVALPGDKNSVQFRMLVIDVATGDEIAVNYRPIEDSFLGLRPFTGNNAWWSGDGRHVYFLDMARGQKSVKLVSVELQTGDSNILFEESSDTYIELAYCEYPSALVPLPETNELIWLSERSGWAHLYLYDLATGDLKNTVTSGDWLVRSLLHFDKDKRECWIQLAGRVGARNPYYRELARVNIDTGEMATLVSSDHDYSLDSKGISFSNDFVVITRSRVDESPVTQLYDRNGKTVLTVETADIAGLPEGWQWPEPVTMKADDGVTDIYGVVYRPSNFDPNKKYPILDSGLTAPFASMFPTSAFFIKLLLSGTAQGNFFTMTYSALAELGFIVVCIESRGTPYRSKAFHDFSYGPFMEGEVMVDHVTGIKQLAERYPSMDLNNVGIMSIAAPGNMAVDGLLNFPDFYKVGVAYSLWDPRLVKYGEVYCGITDEAAQQLPVWKDRVQNLQGKLLLIMGLIDPVFPPSMSFQLVDAVTKANKDIDMLVLPNGGHGAYAENVGRHAWDYVVQHLRAVEPPNNYKLVTGFEKAIPFLFPDKKENW